MKVLLDTNIVIHREAGNIVNPDIGVLFKWLDDLHYQKCVHPVTVEEINKHKDPKTVATFNIKLSNYHLLKTKAPLHQTVQQVCSKIDKDENDLIDTTLLNELVNNRIDILISEDKQISHKALLLGVYDRVFTIDSFLEKVTVENPRLQNYKVLAVKQEYFGNLNLADEFFLTLKQDYPGFDEWFNKKADEIAYVCRQDNKILAFLYLKIERENEDYSDITPAFSKKKRFKIGTFKVDYNGFKLGERFLKIIFDNAIQAKVEEIYVTIFNKRLEQQRLIALLETYGFVFYGHKKSGSYEELVYVRDFSKKANRDIPKVTFPYISTKGSIFIVPIYPEYHTNLLPDSILRTESPADYVENEPFRNAISKVYISRSIERNLESGDLIVFYRTGGLYKGVVTTLGIVESVVINIKDEHEFIHLCGKRSVFSVQELLEHWNYKRNNRPFIVNFLYAYSFPKRITLNDLINLKIVPDVNSVPRGFTKISVDDFKLIAKETKTDESIIVY